MNRRIIAVSGIAAGLLALAPVAANAAESTTPLAATMSETVVSQGKSSPLAASASSVRFVTLGGEDVQREPARPQNTVPSGAQQSGGGAGPAAVEDSEVGAFVVASLFGLGVLALAGGVGVTAYRRRLGPDEQ